MLTQVSPFLACVFEAHRKRNIAKGRRLNIQGLLFMFLFAFYLQLAYIILRSRKLNLYVLQLCNLHLVDTGFL